MRELPFREGEIVGMTRRGTLRLWDSVLGEPYDSGETLREWLGRDPVYRRAGEIELLEARVAARADTAEWQKFIASWRSRSRRRDVWLAGAYLVVLTATAAYVLLTWPVR